MADDSGTERHIEMTWRCRGCEHRNLGRFKVCTECGKPKDDEPYEMPADTASAVTVTDADLLRMATAGPNWRCAYCGSTQRAYDGGCDHCGASAAPKPVTSAEPFWKRAQARGPWAIVGALVVVCAGVPLLVWNAHRPRTYNGVVTKIAWEQVIDVDRYANHDHEGFKENIPGGATDIVSVGDKLHHQEQVFDHMGTESYTVDVPDGYRTETYTDSSDCEQSCTTSAPICHEDCASSGNGFASCHQVCTGGSTSCAPKPGCGTTHTRQIAQTRSETSTREVPVYRNEPRYAEGFHY
jgi:hypothetical protein